MFIGKTDVEAEISILWPPDSKNWLIWKDPDAGKDRKREEKGTTEDEVVGWHHQHNGHEFECIPGDSEGQGGLSCFCQCAMPGWVKYKLKSKFPGEYLSFSVWYTSFSMIIWYPFFLSFPFISRTWIKWIDPLLTFSFI